MIIPNIWENKKCSKPPTRYHITWILCQIMGPSHPWNTAWASLAGAPEPALGPTLAVAREALTRWVARRKKKKRAEKWWCSMVSSGLLWFNLVWYGLFCLNLVKTLKFGMEKDETRDLTDQNGWLYLIYHLANQRKDGNRMVPHPGVSISTYVHFFWG